MKDQHIFYMKIAQLTAGQSYCDRNKVGAIIVKDNNIISFGYNGTPYGMDNCCENIIPSDGIHKTIISTKPEVLHAESNAILKCARNGYKTSGGTLYTTVSPCIECAKLIIQAGIERIYFLDVYRDVAGLELLTSLGILCICLYGKMN